MARRITSTLVEVALALKEHTTGITFMLGRDKTRFVSYRDLFRQAKRWLAALQRQGLNPGQPLLIQSRDNEQIVTAFWASLLGGIIPVLLAVGTTGEQRRRLAKVYQILGTPTYLTQRAIRDALCTASLELARDASGHLPGQTLLFEELHLDDEEPRLYCAKAQDIALIQFSSGSTTTPKGWC